MNKFVKNDVRYRKDPVTSETDASSTRIFGQAVSVGQPYHLESDAQFKRDLEQSLEEIVTKRLQEAEDEAIGLVRIAEQTAKINAEAIADDILAKANAQAKAMLESARNEVDSIQETAREAGFKAGFQEGYADAAQQVEHETLDLLKGVHSVTEKAYQAEKLVLKNFDKNAVALIGHLTRKILRRELADSPEILLTLVHQAVDSLYLSGKIKIVVNAQTLQDIRNFSANTETMMDNLNRFEFIADPALDMEQVFIIGEEGCFDLSPEQQAEQLLATFEEQLTLPRPETAANSAPDRKTPELEPSPVAESLEIVEPMQSQTPEAANLEMDAPPIDAEFIPAESVLPEPELLQTESLPDEVMQTEPNEEAQNPPSAEPEMIRPAKRPQDTLKSAPSVIRDADAAEAKAFEFEDFEPENPDEALS